MDARQLKVGRGLLELLAGAFLGVLATGASAAVITGSLVAGSTCPGTSSASYTPGGATQAVTLCISSDSNICGGTYILKSALAAEDGRFTVTARALLGSVMTDPNTPSPSFPLSIVTTGTVDLGGTAPTAASQPPAANLAVATFTIAPQATATNASYVISLLNSGITSTTSDCVSPAGFVDNAISASFTFNKAVVAAPVATIAVSPSSVPDNGTPLTYTVTLTPAPSAATPVSITSAVVGTMTGVTNNCTGTVTVSTSGTGTCTISATNTVVGDGPATATVNVVAGTGYTVGAPASAAGTITNDDSPVPSTITVAVSPASVAENSGTPLVYTFTSSAAAATSTALLITPPAASGRYSTTCASPVTLPASATTVTCSVTPINNTALDGSVTATVTLLPSAGVYTVGTPSSATGTITDDEIGLGVVASVSSAIEGGTVVFTLSCTGTGTATANFSFSGSYTPLPANGSRVVTCGTPSLVNVPTADDSIVNGTRTITLTINSLTAVTGSVVINPAAASATASILDNDAPTVIPTMSTLGLALLGLLLAGFAGFSVRRRSF